MHELHTLMRSFVNVTRTRYLYLKPKEALEREKHQLASTNQCPLLMRVNSVEGSDDVNRQWNPMLGT